MKKTFTMAAIAAATLCMSSCGFGGSATSTTGNILGNVATGVLGNMVGGNNTGSNLASTGLSLLSNLLGGNTVSTNSITGTWTYAQPEVTFESNNILASIGGELAGNKVENMLGTQLQKIGLKPGVTSFTFDNSGNVTMNIAGKQTKGTYTLSGNTLTMKGALGLASLKATVSIKGNQMYMLFDATTLFNALTKLGSNSSTISSLLGSFNGMKLGWSMTK